VAKTRKTSRKTASRKKKSATKKARPAKRAAPAKPSVEMKGTKMNLVPLKAHMKLHLDRLKSAKAQGGKVQEAIDTLTRSLSELNDECLPTMELELG
jgi:hypothetical protein